VESDHEAVDRIRRRMVEHREAIGAQYDAVLRVVRAAPAGAG